MVVKSESQDNIIELITDQNKSLTPLHLSAMIINIFDYIRVDNGDCHYGLGYVKLQKIMWTSYIRYFHKTRKSLVNSEFLACKYGPILKEIYTQYKQDYPKINDFTNIDTIVKINKKNPSKGISINQIQLNIIIKSCIDCYDFSGLDLSIKSHKGIWAEIHSVFKDAKLIPFEKVVIYYTKIAHLTYEW